MYDIRQFRPALYILIILGISGFALAAQAPGLWLIASGLILFNGWLIKQGVFKPLPRLLANGITLSALLYIVYEVRINASAPILLIGQFLVILQLVKIYEQRANRDYAQLLVLSLLLVVAASINTASLLFGLILIAYLFLSLYCCLLFHLKVETDHARAAIGLPNEKINPATLRQDQRYLARSMRRLTFMVSSVSVVMAVVVFLFFPRGTGAGLLGPLSARSAATLTGFSNEVSFEQVAKIQQNNEIVGYVRLWHGDQQVRGTTSILLRGTTLDLYKGSDANAVDQWRWVRTSRQDEVAREGARGEIMQLMEGRSFPPGELWRQEIELRPIGTSVLFALPGPVTVINRNDDSLRLKYSASDETLQSNDPTHPLLQQYEVLSRYNLEEPGEGRRRLQPRDPSASGSDPGNASSGPVEVRPDRRIDPKIEAYARRPEVSGVDDRGALAARRNPLDGPVELDEQLATNIEQYLRKNFSYTLDLTDARALSAGQDPLVAFLYDFKRGHCEYFAGAMTLMCQSLGMEARIVLGFRCDEYNGSLDKYTIRQSQAHAWVEVHTPRGWVAFDPTTSRGAETVKAESAWGRVKHFFDFLEYTWANSVVAYDRDSRGNLMGSVTAAVVNTAGRGTQAAGNVRDWFKDAQNFLFVSSKLLSGLIWLMTFAIVGAICGYLYQQYKLRQRAQRIGLDALPTSDQLRLARQLGFYDELVQLLERRGIHRPAHLTPREFSESIAFLPTEAFDMVKRLTQVFYRIRYGRHEISGIQQKRLSRMIERIDRTLSP